MYKNKYYINNNQAFTKISKHIDKKLGKNSFRGSN